MLPKPQVRPEEVQLDAVRAQGPGGQNVHKVSSAAHLRFDIPASSLPDEVKARLLTLRDSRITTEGVVVIKAQRTRSLGLNQADAMARLQALVDAAATPPTLRSIFADNFRLTAESSTEPRPTLLIQRGTMRVGIRSRNKQPGAQQVN